MSLFSVFAFPHFGFILCEKQSNANQKSDYQRYTENKHTACGAKPIELEKHGYFTSFTEITISSSTVSVRVRVAKIIIIAIFIFFCSSFLSRGGAFAPPFLVYLDLRSLSSSSPNFEVFSQVSFPLTALSQRRSIFL